RRSEEELMDLEVEVTERSTGQFTAGIGFSSIENVVFTASVSQSNLFGRGQTIGASARIGTLSQDVVLDFQEPYLFGRPINAGVSLFRRSSDYNIFKSKRTGIGLRACGVSLSELSVAISELFVAQPTCRQAAPMTRLSRAASTT